MLLALLTASPAVAGNLSPEAEAALVGLPGAATLTVMVHLKDRADLGAIRGDRTTRHRATIQALRSHADSTQRPIHALLQARLGAGGVAGFTPFWVINGFALTATAPVIRLVAALPSVEVVTLDAVAVVPSGTPPSGTPEPNVTATRAPELWSLGYTGAGVVVATLDSGADASHPDVASKWRGGTNSWFDPYGQHATPYDPSGHGTWTLGVIVGGDAGGTTIGVAPGATWIAAKIFNDAGSATATAIHRAFQWVLDPDGDPNTADAPDVVNNSWSYGAPGCNLEFQADLQALRAAGILPVFAAGNFGPGTSTSVSPANYPEALSVGATNDVGDIAYDSSRGPSACGGATFPGLAAPGVNILTSDLFSYYAAVSGTSIAAPHVSGVAALLAGAVPSASAGSIEQAMKLSALDLGIAGPDDVYGSGWVDARSAYDALLASPPPPPPPPPPAPPTAGSDAYSIAEDVTLVMGSPGVLANDAAPSGKALSAILVTGPVHGTLSLQSSGGFTYTPAPNYNGPDAFTYLASDGSQQSAAATVSISVSAVNDPPVAVNDAAATARNVAVNIAVLANDTDVDGTISVGTLTIVSAPKSGSASKKSNGTVTYTPKRNFVGTDSFTYTVKDNSGALSRVATVTVQVK